MDIDWQRVPNERRKEAEILDSRLKKYETGVADNYGNKIAAVSMMMQYLLGHLNAANNAIDETLPVTEQMFDELNASYDAIDLGELPLNDYTRPFYVCASLYFDLKRTYETLEEQIDAGEDLTRSLNGIKDMSQKIIDIGRETYSNLLTSVLTPLEAICGDGNIYPGSFGDRYTSKMAMVHMLSGASLKCPEESSKAIRLMEEIFQETDNIHSNIGPDDPPDNIASKLTSPVLYSHLRETYETLKEQIDTGEDITGYLDDLKDTSQKIIKIGREAQSYLLTSVLTPLEAICGGTLSSNSFNEHYIRKMAMVHLLSGASLSCLKGASKAIHLMENVSQDIDSIHRNMGLGKVPLNADTEVFFTCRPLYLKLIEAYRAFEQLTPVLDELEKSAETVKKDSKAIVDHARPKYLDMITNVLNPLESIPGCENRILHKKRPKNT